MELTVTFDLDQIIAINNALRISEKDYEAVLHGKDAPEYAKRICMARRAMKMSMQKDCIDPTLK